MWWEECFKWLEVCYQVEHIIKSLEIGLDGWQFNIKF
jgi:hypothetical protein